MRNLRRLVWSKGMFLTPQHFQAHDNCWEDTLHFRFVASEFANRGAIELAIDEEALTNGQFVLRHCRAIMPDGAPIDCPDVDELPAGRPVKPFFQPTHDSLHVFLALPERRSQAQNYAHALPEGAAAPEANVRYTARVHEVRDETGLDEDKPVQFAQKNLQILFEGQNLDGFVTLRLARVIRAQSGAFALDPEFVPPVLNIAASTHLTALLTRQIEELGTKSNDLSAVRRQKGKTLADFGAAETANFWLLHTVNSYLPELKHIWSTRRGHPEPLFVALLSLAGALSTFSLDADPRSLPEYDHDNLGPCFSALDARIRSLLETVIPSKCICVPLRPGGEKGIWVAPVSDEQWFRNSQFILAINGSIATEDLIRKVTQLVKISAPEDIQNLVRHALPGLGLRHTPVPPSAISVRLDTQYFALSQAGRLWDSIVRSRSLSFFIPPELNDARSELQIVLP